MILRYWIENSISPKIKSKKEKPTSLVINLPTEKRNEETKENCIKENNDIDATIAANK